MQGEMIGQGRRVQKDERNTKFELPLMKPPPGVRERYWYGGNVLDQGETPQCVGYAGWGWLAGGPVVNHPKFTPSQLYRWAQQNDEWPGEDYEGTSTLGLMKALKAKGYINEYRWAFDAKTLVAWLLTKGPVLVGTNWYLDMCNPTVRTGFIEPTGQNVGGHEWRIVGVDCDRQCHDGTKGAVRMINSWGVEWGDHGRAWVAFNDLDKLIKDDGEAVTATEIHL